MDGRFPQYSCKLFGQRWSFCRTKRTISKARTVITMSEHSPHDMRRYGVSRKITMIYNGVSDAFRPLFDPTRLAKLSIFRGRAIVSLCFVGNDEGTMHIAAALGTPMVGLFGLSNPLEWAEEARISVIDKELHCRQ